MQLHEKIVSHRKKLGFSQEALAEQLGVSRQAVSKWETGEALPEIPKLKALADCFGVTVDFLVDDDLDEPPRKEMPGNESVNRTNIFDDAIDTVGERAVPFVKKYAWLGGVIIIIIGIASVVKGVISLITAFGVSAQFGEAGIFGAALPALLSAVFGLVFPIAILVCGIVILKKFKP